MAERDGSRPHAPQGLARGRAARALKALGHLSSGSARNSLDRAGPRYRKSTSAIVSDDQQVSHLWTIAVEGGAARQLTEGPFHAKEAAWSPRGDKIVFVSRPTAGANEDLLSDLYVVRADGGGPRRIVTNEGPDFAPAWSPDGSRIAYLSNGRRQSSGANNGIMKVPASGGAPHQVTTGFEYSAGEPRWSPDGGTIYF